MEKPVITKEQAEAIEIFKSEQVQRFEEVKKNKSAYIFSDWEKSLLDLDSEELEDALYIGYEVEPEFELNDYIHHTENNVTQKLDTQEKVDFINNHYLQREKVRHATPSEIAEEKERRWWKKHGRDVWELRKGDILRRREGKMVEYVAKAQGEEVWLEYRGRPNTLDLTRKYFCVACFAENRLDQEVGE